MKHFLSTFSAISASCRLIVLLLLVVNISGASFCTVLIFVLGINCRLISLLWPLFSDLHHRNGCILLTSDLMQFFFPPHLFPEPVFVLWWFHLCNIKMLYRFMGLYFVVKL